MKNPIIRDGASHLRDFRARDTRPGGSEPRVEAFAQEAEFVLKAMVDSPALHALLEKELEETLTDDWGAGSDLYTTGTVASGGLEVTGGTIDLHHLASHVVETLRKLVNDEDEAAAD